MHCGAIGVEIEFDFIDHKLDMRTSDGRTHNLPLEPRSVASFYEMTMAALSDLGLHVATSRAQLKVLEAIPFALDNQHCAYDADAAHRFWLMLAGIASRDGPLPFSVHRQGQPRAFLLGRGRPRGDALFGPTCPKASRRCPELRRLGASTRLQPRSEQLRFLARRRR